MPTSFLFRRPSPRAWSFLPIFVVLAVLILLIVLLMLFWTAATPQPVLAVAAG